MEKPDAAEVQLFNRREIRQESVFFQQRIIKGFASRQDRVKVGLGIAAGSGLLSILFPEHFGTVDEFVVIALARVSALPEDWRNEIVKMNRRLQKSKNTKNGSFQLSLSEGVLLVEIMRAKARQLNEWFQCRRWTPRKVDMVLWGNRSEGDARGCG